VNQSLYDLPLSVRDWPTQPGYDLPGGAAARRYKERRANWCDDRRNNWHCTRERDHELPHVGAGLSTIVAVWDQQWFGDRDHAQPIPVADVPRLGKLTDSQYRDLTNGGSDRIVFDPF
jgi:hypothetical protein